MNANLRKNAFRAAILASMTIRKKVGNIKYLIQVIIAKKRPKQAMKRNV